MRKIIILFNLIFVLVTVSTGIAGQSIPSTVRSREAILLRFIDGRCI